jgi:type I restriction enzyme R subunit
MNDYTARDKKNYGNTGIAKVAYPKFLEKLSIRRDIFHGYDYFKFTTEIDLERSKAITGAVNFTVAVNKEKDRNIFIKEALLLKQALSLCSLIVERDLRIEFAFFESVRVLVMRLMNQGEEKKISLPEMNARINELLKQNIKSDGVINLFSDVRKNFQFLIQSFLKKSLR